MPKHVLYISTDENALLGGLNTAANIQPRQIPFYYGDTLSLNIYLMEKIQNITNASVFPYDIMSTAGIQLFLFITDGTEGGTIYTQQITWSTDPLQTFFSANLSLATANLKALVDANPNAQARLKIGYVQNGLPATVYDATVNIGVGIPQTTLVVPAGQTPLSAEVAAATYFPLSPVNGMPLQIASPSGIIITIRAVDNGDGTASLKGS